MTNLINTDGESGVYDYGPIGASQLMDTGRGRPRNSQPGTAALRSAGVRACELRHRLGALPKVEMRPWSYTTIRLGW